MATLDDAAAIAMSLPGVTEGTRYGNRAWYAGKACFAWERPLSKADVKRWGDAPLPDGELLGVLTDDLHEKAALLAEGRPGVFTIAHFDNYPALLLELSRIRTKDLKALITGAYQGVQ